MEPEKSIKFFLVTELNENNRKITTALPLIFSFNNKLLGFVLLSI